MKYLLGILCFYFLNLLSVQAQEFLENRSTFYAYTGTSGANLSQFNALLVDRGYAPLVNRYRSYGLGYQVRMNDFIGGFELSQHQGTPSEIDGFRLDYRTSRAMLQLGYSLTEEGKFQLIHYLSMGLGYLNFQMLPKQQGHDLDAFLTDPRKGLILRKNDIQKGSSYFGNFLTEIGFQLSYDLPIPHRKEAWVLVAKAGYAFSPFEENWKLNGVSFDNAQAGAFFRVGTGISLPDRNFFYKDASLGISVLRGFHLSKPTQFNSYLEKNGYSPLEGRPSNLGLRILGETDGLLYGVDVYNLSMKGKASATQSHSLNSLRVYANTGIKFFQYKNLAFGALGGLGYGNLRYTLTQDLKPSFPQALDRPNFDGYLRNFGIFLKPELTLEYGIPVTKRKFFDVLISGSLGYEQAFPGFKLGGLSMNSFQSGPYYSLGLGIKP